MKNLLVSFVCTVGCGRCAQSGTECEELFGTAETGFPAERTEEQTG